MRGRAAQGDGAPVSGYDGDWQLVGADSDPWPGDTYAVSSAVRHYSEMANAVREQAQRLRAIANSTGTTVGQYVEGLADSAGKAADLLERAEGRFDTVASQLSRWEPELDYGQTQSRALLRTAETHHATIAANQAPSTRSTPLTPKQLPTTTRGMSGSVRHRTTSTSSGGSSRRS